MYLARALAIGERAAATTFDEPFEMLEACHDRVRRSLALLERLVEHLRRNGHSVPVREAACDVMRYFDIAAPLHQQDEERHVFPRLEASDDPQLVALARRLRADHRLIEAQWWVLWPLLEQVARGRSVALEELEVAARHFAALHADHLLHEEQIAFPGARIVLASEGTGAAAVMGDEMAARRGASPAAATRRAGRESR
jgi:hemerythrin-like domain-containing protein